MEETDKTELSTLTKYIRAELELVGCAEINITTVPIKNTGSTEITTALHLEYFTKNIDFYDVQVTKCIDQNWNDRLCVKVKLRRIFQDGEMIPIGSLTIDDTLTAFKTWTGSTEVRLEHNVSGSIVCKSPCDANSAAELVTYIFEISKL